MSQMLIIVKQFNCYLKKYNMRGIKLVKNYSKKYRSEFTIVTIKCIHRASHSISTFVFTPFAPRTSKCILKTFTQL